VILFIVSSRGGVIAKPMVALVLRGRREASRGEEISAVGWRWAGAEEIS
jgi:hypothetical protein